MLVTLEKLAPEFRTTAPSIDKGDSTPALNLQRLAEAGLYQFVVTAKPGLRRRALDLLSSGCGVTAFVSSQHEGVCRRLFQAGHPLLQEATVGRRWCGVCFAHLRRKVSPIDAIEQRNIVTFSGSGPWFTGHGLMQTVMVGGATSEGRLLMGVAPIDSPEIVVKPLPKLAVMNASATVGLDFNALPIERTDIIVDITPEELEERDMHSTVFQGARSLGAARAACLYLPQHAQVETLAKIEALHKSMDEQDQQLAWDMATQLRLRALKLAGQAIDAAFVNVGGKAHLLSHPLQRIAREASFYSTTQLTQQLKKRVTNEIGAS